jgi:4-amino-4-deoxy-L-arabinose transferase-like glycosyltransferase/cytochrome c-type biogenesis protein CcmH/NrfG
MKRRLSETHYWAAGIFLLALAVRLVYLWQMKSSPLFDSPMMDAEYHDQWAQAIVAGGDFTGGVFFRAPLYPYFLALVYGFFGHNYLMARMVQFLIGSLSCVLVYSLAKRVFNRRTAAIAGVAASLYGVLIYFDGELLIPVLLVFLDLILILSLLWADHRPSYAGWGVCGAVLGLSALARPNILLVGAALLVWMILRSGGKKGAAGSKPLLWAGCFVLGAMVIVSPVTVRNYVKGHDLVLIASQGGMNFYIGNNARSDGASAILPGARATWWGSYDDAREMAEKASGKSLKPSQVSRYWYIQGLKFATGKPSAFLELMAKKFALFWNGNELSNNRDFYFFARSTPVLSLLIWRQLIFFPFGLVVPLAILGIFFSHRERKKVAVLEIFLLFYMLSIILFFVTARYRVPLIPVFIIFAAYALDRLILQIRQRRCFEFAKYVGVFLLICIPVNLRIPGYSDSNPGQAHYTLGVTYADRGDMVKAEEEYQTALSLNPAITEAYVNLGSIYGDRGDHQRSLEYYRTALKMGADSALVLYNIAIEYYNQGLLDQAKENFESSLAIRDDNPQAHYLLGETYGRMQMPEEAIKQYQNAIGQDSSYAMPYYRLGMIYNRMGDRQKTIENLEEFLRLWKGDRERVAKVGELLEELKTAPGP